jgi:protein-tyrosine phosphatase
LPACVTTGKKHILAQKFKRVFERLKGIFGSREEATPPLADYSQMVVDMHSHLIPGIDDGVKTMDDSIFLLRRLVELGFKKVITTPHVMADGYINTTETILAGRDAVRQAIKDNLIPIEFEASGEYNIDESLYPKIEKKDLLAFGKNYVLVEMPFLAKPSIMGDILYKLQIAGYNVILAHPERYSYFHENKFESYISLKDRNILFQINIASLTGVYGKDAQYTAERMIDNDMVNFIGSDLHGQRHMELLQEALGSKYLQKIISNPKLLNKTLL